MWKVTVDTKLVFLAMDGQDGMDCNSYKLGQLIPGLGKIDKSTINHG